MVCATVNVCMEKQKCSFTSLLDVKCPSYEDSEDPPLETVHRRFFGCPSAVAIWRFAQTIILYKLMEIPGWSEDAWDMLLWEQCLLEPHIR